MKITAYTDGSAKIQYPHLGGSGVYIKTPAKTFKIRKGYCNTKTGRAELHACIICMQSVKDKKADLTIYSDSQYVCNTVNLWIDNWKNLGFMGKANVDLLEQLYLEIWKFRRRPKLIHIKGHQEVTKKREKFVREHVLGNNIADALANYKTQTSYEVDLPLSNLATFEIEDYEEIEGKLYYKTKEPFVKGADDFDWNNETLNR